MTGTTETLTGIINIDERHEMTAYNDILNIVNATISLVVPGDIFTNESDDTVTITDSTLSGEDGTSLFLGSGNDTLTMKNVTLSLSTLTGSGNDYVSIVGDAQSSVSLQKLNSGATLSLGSGDDVLELASVLSGSGELDFGDGADTLCFNGGQLTMTGTISNVENLTVTTAGGVLNKDITLSGSKSAITFDGNLSSTSSYRAIYITSTEAGLFTGNNIKTNIRFDLTGTTFTQQSGGTLEISGTGDYAVRAVDSVVTLHDIVLTNNSYGGLSGTDTFWNITNGNISNSSSYGVNLSGGALNITSGNFSNNQQAVHLSNAELTGSDLAFNRNNSNNYGGAIYSDSAINLNKVSFVSNSATSGGGAIYGSNNVAVLSNATFSKNSARSYYGAGGAIYQTGGTLSIYNGEFSGNFASRSGGAIYAKNALINLTNVVMCSNTAGVGGAIYLAGGATLTYSVTSGKAIVNSGNYASSYSSGAFLYANSSDKVIFDIAENASLTISDNFDGYGTMTKSGTGYMLVTTGHGNSTNWVISTGTLELGSIARSIDLKYFSIGVGGLLKLSSFNDTVNMSTDKNIGILDLGGGDDVINTQGYALSGGELRISKLRLTGDGRISSNIISRDADAGFDLTLAQIHLESSIIGGNAQDLITVTGESTVSGILSLGGGDDTITVSAATTFENDLILGDGNDEIALNAQTEFKKEISMGAGDNNIIAIKDTVAAPFSVKITKDALTRVIAYKGAVLTDNTVSVYEDPDVQLNTYTLDWDTLTEVNKVRIFVSDDDGFDTYEFVLELYNQSRNFTLNVQNGYYLKFMAQDEDGWEEYNTIDYTKVPIQSEITESPVTDNLSGTMNLVREYEMTTKADTLNISDASISLSIAGDIFTNEGDDTINISGSKLLGTQDTGLYSGSGNDRFNITNTEFDVNVHTGSGSDHITIYGDSQSKVSLATEKTLSLGSGDDILELASVLSGTGRLDFGDGADTLCFNGGQLTMTGKISNVENLTVTTAGGVLNKDITLSGSKSAITFDGNLSSTSSDRAIYITSTETDFFTGNNIKTNIRFDLTGTTFTQQSGGTLEIKGNNDYAVRAVDSVVTLHDIVLTNNYYGGLSGTDTFWNITNGNISNSSSYGVNLSGGALNITSGNFSNNKQAVHLSNAELTGSDLAFNKNNSSNYGGAIYSDSAINLNKVSFVSNSATSGGGGAIYGNNNVAVLSNATFSKNSAGYYGSGGAIYQTGGTLSIYNGEFSGNKANYSGGAIYARNALVNLTNVVMCSNTADTGGAICLAGGATLTYCVTSGKEIVNSGNYASYSSGAFLYANSSDKVIFDIAENAVLTISDSFYGYGTMTKSGTGYMLVTADHSSSTNWVISTGTLELGSIARSIDLGYFNIGIDGILKLSSRNDTVYMSTDKNIGILDLGGGDDVINTQGYALSGGELRISKLRLSGNGRISSNIITRDADAGFDLTLAQIHLESSIIGGNAQDLITVTGESTISGILSLGGGDDTITVSATTTFENDLILGDGNDTITVSAATTFENDLILGDGNDKITLNAATEMAGIIDMGSGMNTITVNDSLKVSSYVQMTSGGSTTIIVNRNTTLDKNILKVCFDENSEDLIEITYNWANIADLDKVRLVVSSDETFAAYEFSVELYNQSKTFTIITEKSNYIQFQAQDEDGWKLRVLDDEIAPEQVSGFSMQGTTAVWEATHDNLGGNGVKKYNIQVANDAKFYSVIGTYTSDTNSYSFDSYADGNYFIRIQAEDHTGNKGEWSSIENLLIDRTAPAAPIAVLSTTEPTQSVLVTAAYSNDSVLKQYKIGSDGEWTDYIGAFIVSENAVISLRAQDAVGNESTSSVVVSNIDRAEPNSPGKSSVKLSNYNATINWSDAIDNVANGIKGYYVRYGQSAALSGEGVFVEVSDLSLENLALGRYYYQIKAVDKAGNSSEWTAVRYFDVDLLGIRGDANGVSWSAAPGSTNYTVEYSNDNFANILTLHTSGNQIDSFRMPGGTWQYRVKADEMSDFKTQNGFTAAAPGDAAKFVSDADGNMDLFFVKATENNGSWSDGYYAKHTGTHNGWSGTDEIISLNGKNKIADVFMGSSDANVLVLTDDANGDALFIDDMYSALGNQARLSQIDEIRAGAGNDIVDLTSNKYAFAGDKLTIFGGAGDDTIWANNGSNTLFGDAGNDRLVGGSGNDCFIGGSGNDSLHGGGGNDIFCFGGNWGKDTVEQLSGGKVTLHFENGSLANWNSATGVYSDGVNSVTVTGTTDITLKFGADETLPAGAFLDAASEKIFEDKNKGMLA